MRIPLGTVTFHVRPRPSDFQPGSSRRRKKKPAFSHAGVAHSDSHLLAQSAQSGSAQGVKLPFLVEANPDGSEVTTSMPLRYVVPPNVTEVI